LGQTGNLYPVLRLPRLCLYSQSSSNCYQSFILPT